MALNKGCLKEAYLDVFFIPDIYSRYASFNQPLCRALDKGWLKEAYLDVFSIEPLPQSSDLWTHPKVTG